MAAPEIASVPPAQRLADGSQQAIDKSSDGFFERIAKLSLLALLVYWSYVIISPFITILVWSVILAVTLYPAFNWIARHLGDRRKLAAAIVTLLTLAIFTGPIIWLGLSMMEGLIALSERINAGDFVIPPPSEGVKTWPLIGQRLFDIWNLASTNLKSALTEVLPYLDPLKSFARQMGQNAAIGIPSFFISVIGAGFLLYPAPKLMEGGRRLARRLLPEHGQEYVVIAAAAIRNVSQGVVGVSLLQAVLAGIGFAVAGVPGAGLLALAVLVLGILRFPSLVLIPVIIWAWVVLPPWTAVALTAYLVPVGMIDNILVPIVLTHGLRTPMVVITLGVLGGAAAHGLIGLFIGPIILAVGWELIAAWVRQNEPLPFQESAEDPPQTKV